MPDETLPKKGKKKIENQYGIYSGIVNKEGKTKKAPTVNEAVSNMADYMKSNRTELTNHRDGPSNVYRPEFQHMGVAYDRKKKQKDT
mgnify:CR=1 FL=1